MPLKRKASGLPRGYRAKRTKYLSNQNPYYARGLSYRASRARYNTKKARLDKRINIHSYARWATTPEDITVSSTEFDGCFTPSFDLIKAYSEFTALYDRYKITNVQIQLSLITNPNSANPTNIAAASATTYYNNPTNWYPKFWYLFDYDDDSAISLSVMRERSKVKCFILQPNKLYKINLKPSILVQSYGTAVTTGYTPKWNQWVDMANTAVKHYGMKYVVDTQGVDPDNTYPFKVRMEYRYFFTCKDVL